MAHILPFPIWILLVAISSLTVLLLLNPPTARHDRGEGVAQPGSNSVSEAFDGTWYPPTRTPIDDLESVLNGDGVFGLEFRSDDASDKGGKRSRTEDAEPYAGWNWCNMPHVNPQTYVQPTSDYRLDYVEVIHRHHKRTPYAANLFPQGPLPWSCDSTSIFSYSSAASVNPASTFYSPYAPASNPFSASFPGGESERTCLYPQITAGGLEDSRKHGQDLQEVYGKRLSFLPNDLNGEQLAFRVTNNPITAHIASAVIAGMYPQHVESRIPLLVQPTTIDSLEPTYPCALVSILEEQYGVGSDNPNWTEHLKASAQVFEHLDRISQVPTSDSGWHQSFDHYFDNLSARLCHALPLPCSADARRHSGDESEDESTCVDRKLANTVFRLGHYEYSYLYRNAPPSLHTNTARFGAWIAELASNLRAAASEQGLTGHSKAGGSQFVKYRHNVAHDGSIAALLSILQADVMVWPGMGAEIVFELWSSEPAQSHSRSRSNDKADSLGNADLSSRHGGDAEGGRIKHQDQRERFVRVLWGGVPLRSSHPMLGQMNMIPLHSILEYFDILIGNNGAKVPELCKAGNL